MKAHFVQFAAYNHWANCRLVHAISKLDREQRNRPLGLFFGSLHGTLNHLIVTDRMWLGRLIGKNLENGPLDKILFENLRELALARMVEDQRLVSLVNGYEEADFDQMITYRNTSGNEYHDSPSAILAHLFNHQTHHRAQAHTGLSILTAEPESLDLLLFQRGLAAPDAEVVIAACGPQS